MDQFVRSIKDLFFPPVCICCRRCVVGEDASPVELICRRCCDTFLESAAQATPRCKRCGFPTAILETDTNVLSFPCLECTIWRFQFSSTDCLGAYRGRLKNLVLQAKMASGAPLAFALGQAIGARLSTSAFELVMPVPMHWRRRLFRQQNTAEVIARGILSRVKTRVVLETRAVKTSRMTQKQGTLSPKQRRQNVKNAFQVTQPKKVSGRRVLVVDDVMTTGATLHEMTRQLLRHGASKVDIAVVCRAGAISGAREE